MSPQPSEGGAGSDAEADRLTWRPRRAGETHISLWADRTNTLDGPWWFDPPAWDARRWRLIDELATTVSERIARADLSNVVHLPRRGLVVSIEYAGGDFVLYLVPPGEGERLELARGFAIRAWACAAARLVCEDMATRGAPCRIVGL